VINGGALGTPSSGVATNLTGTAAGLSIGGNAATASVAAQVETTAVSGNTALYFANLLNPFSAPGGTPVYAQSDIVYDQVTTTLTAPHFSGALAGNSTSATNIAGGTIGAISYQSGASTTAFLAGNTSTTPEFVTSTGTGSAALAPTLTSSTGSGSVVLSTSPTLVTPALGTPSALVGTNITGTAAGLNIGGSAATVTAAAQPAITSVGTLTGLTVGSGSAQTTPIANGDNSLTNGGAAFIAQNAGTPIIGIGNYSALVGGTYSGAPMLWSSAAISTNHGLNIGGNSSITGTLGVTAASAAPSIVSYSNTDTNVNLVSNGTLILQNNNNTVGNFTALDTNDASGAVITRIASVVTDQTNHSGAIAFVTRNAGSYGERARFTSNGNLLVGTTTDNGTDIAQFNGSVTATKVGIGMTAVAPLDVALGNSAAQFGSAGGNNIVQAYTNSFADTIGFWPSGTNRIFGTGSITFSVNATAHSNSYPTGYTDAVTVLSNGNLSAAYGVTIPQGQTFYSEGHGAATSGIVLDQSGIAQWQIFQEQTTGILHLADQGGNAWIRVTPTSGKTVLSGAVQLQSTLQFTSYTVSTLPAGSDGMTAYVTDAVSPTWHGTLTGGGTVHTPVYYSGSASAWLSY
jgi:hypothetical protein